jgi:hypothetical protein
MRACEVLILPSRGVAMSSIVTVKNENPPGGKSVLVLVQAITGDGRERIDNGFHTIAPGASKMLVVDSTQCFRVMDDEQPAEE